MEEKITVLLFCLPLLCAGLSARDGADAFFVKIGSMVRSDGRGWDYSLHETVLDDTVFLYRNGSDEFYHAIFIDYCKSSSHYDAISRFGFSESDMSNYNQSLEYLEMVGAGLEYRKIRSLPARWIALYQYDGRFYAYCPSDLMFHRTVCITDTAYVEYMSDGPVANRIDDFRRIDRKTFRFRLMGKYKRNSELTVHIIDDKNKVAVFEERTTGGKKSFRLMVAADKVRNFPVIVNYCREYKQSEVTFETSDYQRLLTAEK